MIWLPKIKEIALPRRQRGFFVLPGGMGGAKPSGGGAGPTIQSALVALSGNQTPASTFSWGSEVSDVDGWHDNGTNPERLTVISGVSLVRVIANIKSNAISADLALKQMLGGADFNGQAYCGSTPTADFESHCNVVSAPISVSSGNYFTLTNAVSTVIQAANETWFSIETLNPSIKYAHVRKNATQNFTGTSPASFTWQTEIADVGGWFDSATSTTNIVVPSGTSGFVRLCGSFEPNSTSGQSVLSITNGANALLVGLPIKDLGRTGVDMLSVASAPIAVSAGDSFRMRWDGDSNDIAQNTTATWWSIEEVLNYAGCLVSHNASQAVTGGVEVAITMGAESYDTTGTAHDLVTNNSRITIPSGYTKARASFSIVGPSSAGTIRGRVLKNGSAYPGMPSSCSTTTGSDFTGGVGAWVAVTPGDYFELHGTHSASVSLASSTGTWLCVEFAA